jgi:hypothetical protein
VEVAQPASSRSPATSAFREPMGVENFEDFRVFMIISLG